MQTIFRSSQSKTYKMEANISLAISIPEENRPSSSEAAQNSARHSTLRSRVLNVETFVRILHGNSLQNNSVHDVSMLSAMSVEEDIGNHNMAMHNVSMLSVMSVESMASAMSIQEENRPSPSEAAQNSARLTTLRRRVLNIETFIRLLPGSSTDVNNQK